MDRLSRLQPDVKTQSPHLSANGRIIPLPATVSDLPEYHAGYDAAERLDVYVNTAGWLSIVDHDALGRIARQATPVEVAGYAQFYRDWTGHWPWWMHPVGVPAAGFPVRRVEVGRYA